MKVREVMRTEVQSVPVGTSVTDAFQTMRDGGFRHLPVLSSQEMVVGIVSDRDLRNVGVFYREPDSDGESFFVDDDTKIDEVMVSDPVCISPDDDLRSAVQLLRDEHFGCLVVSENGQLSGILSYLDLLDVLHRLLDASELK